MSLSELHIPDWVVDVKNWFSRHRPLVVLVLVVGVLMIVSLRNWGGDTHRVSASSGTVIETPEMRQMGLAVGGKIAGVHNEVVEVRGRVVGAQSRIDEVFKIVDDDKKANEALLRKMGTTQDFLKGLEEGYKENAKKLDKATELIERNGKEMHEAASKLARILDLLTVGKANAEPAPAPQAQSAPAAPPTAATPPSVAQTSVPAPKGPKPGDYAQKSSKFKEYASVCSIGDLSPKLQDEAAFRLEHMSAKQFRLQVGNCPPAAPALARRGRQGDECSADATCAKYHPAGQGESDITADNQAAIEKARLVCHPPSIWVEGTGCFGSRISPPKGF